MRCTFWKPKPHPILAGVKKSFNPQRSAQCFVPARTWVGLRQTCSRRAISSQALSKTPFHELHKSHGGRMVPFANFSMPLQYPDLSLSESHLWTRQKASLFDVSHMVQHRMTGPDATRLLNQITPTSLSNLKHFHSTLSCLLLPESGGIVDDLMISRLGPDSYHVVTNAACREKDDAFINSQINEIGLKHVEWRQLDGWGLIALQGPLSSQILDEVLARPKTIDLDTLLFGQCAEICVNLGSGKISEPIFITRGGYTGEDGFELSLQPSQALTVVNRILTAGGGDRLRWAGLGARDSLRLEAGMCLYGHDLREDTTPIEAGLAWLIGKDRRESADFNGASTIIGQLKTKSSGGKGVTRRRVGMIVQGAPAREGAVIVGSGDEVIGNVTSGSPSPSLGKHIAMGYVKDGFHRTGTEIGVMVRGKRRSAIITKMPFIKSQYWKGSSAA